MTPRLGLAAVALAGCGFPKPYTATMLAEDALRVPEKALVHYLSQAPPLELSVCDPEASGPHVPAIDERLVDAVDKAFAKEKIPVPHWTGCLAGMWRSADGDLRERIASGVLLAFPMTLEDGDLDPNEAIVRLDAIVTIVEGRPEDARLPEAAATDAIARTEAAMAPLEDARKALSERFVAEVGLDLGRWNGAVVDAARITAERDTEVLWRFATRLPDEALRAVAREQIVRVRIADGAWAEARERESEVVRAVLDTGHWALDPATWPVRALAPKEGALGPEALVVVQDLSGGKADLLARSDGVLAAKVDLAPLLSIEVEGLSAPVGLCTPGDGLDPTPCVDPTTLTATHPLVSLDHGVLGLPTGVPSSTAAALARVDRIDVPVAAGEAKSTLSWPVAFAPPSPLILSNPVMGAPGPDLVVRVRTEPTGRFVYEVTRGETTHVVVAEPAHLVSFRVITQGAEGIPGSQGLAGRPGMDGMDGDDAACPYTRGEDGTNGANGGDGGPGGPGGRGGNGGNVQSYLKCSAELACEDLLDLVEPTIVSRGGPGGPGGEGGEGGQPGDGGRGGDPATCTHVGGEDYVDGGHDGIAGLRGDDGIDGQPGPDGRPGTLTFKFVP